MKNPNPPIDIHESPIDMVYNNLDGIKIGDKIILIIDRGVGNKTYQQRTVRAVDNTFFWDTRGTMYVKEHGGQIPGENDSRAIRFTEPLWQQAIAHMQKGTAHDS